MNHIATQLNPGAMDTVVNKLKDASTVAACMEQVQQIFDIYGVGHGCLHATSHPYKPVDALWRVTPDDVTRACSHLVSENRHPAAILGKNRHFAFDLFEFRHHFAHDPDSEALFEAFENNDISHIYGIPVQTQNNGTYVFVVGRPNERIETVELLTLQTICSNAVNMVLQFQSRPCESKRVSKLSGEQRQFLIWLADGKSYEDIAGKLGLSELTIQSMAKHLTKSMGALNIRHAIVLGLIDGEFGLGDCEPV